MHSASFRDPTSHSHCVLLSVTMQQISLHEFSDIMKENYRPTMLQRFSSSRTPDASLLLLIHGANSHLENRMYRSRPLTHILYYRPRRFGSSLLPVSVYGILMAWAISQSCLQSRFLKGRLWGNMMCLTSLHEVCGFGLKGNETCPLWAAVSVVRMPTLQYSCESLI